MERRAFALLAAGTGLFLVAPASRAQSFPTQLVRVVSPLSAGSGPDVAVRLAGEKLSARWKQSVMIDSRPGASGFLAAGVVKQAALTGYDLLLAVVGRLAINPSLFTKLPCDPRHDFVPVCSSLRTSFFIVVGANSPFRTVKDLIAAAAASPGKINYGSTSIGGPPHPGAAQIEAASGTRMTHVPYEEITQLNVAVSTGEIDWTLGSIAGSGALLTSGKVRYLAIADEARSPSLPNVPTLEEAGDPKGVQAQLGRVDGTQGHACGRDRDAEHQPQRRARASRCRRAIRELRLRAVSVDAHCARRPDRTRHRSLCRDGQAHRHQRRLNLDRP